MLLRLKYRKYREYLNYRKNLNYRVALNARTCTALWQVCVWFMRQPIPDVAAAGK